MKNQNRKRPANETGISPWGVAIRAMCTLGGFTVKIEGYRFHFKEAYLELLAPFEHEKWIAWPVGKRYAKLARARDEQLFWEDKKLLEARFGSQNAGSFCGDLPLAIHFLSKGRVNLAAQITEPTGMLKNDRVYVMPRLGGYIEIWNHKRWLEVIGKEGDVNTPPES